MSKRKYTMELVEGKEIDVKIFSGFLKSFIQCGKDTGRIYNYPGSIEVFDHISKLVERFIFWKARNEDGDRLPYYERHLKMIAGPLMSIKEPSNEDWEVLAKLPYVLAAMSTTGNAIDTRFGGEPIEFSSYEILQGLYETLVLDWHRSLKFKYTTMSVYMTFTMNCQLWEFLDLEIGPKVNHFRENRDTQEFNDMIRDNINLIKAC